MPHSKIAQRKNEACALKAGDLIRKCDEDCEKFRFHKDIIDNTKTLTKIEFLATIEDLIDEFKQITNTECKKRAENLLRKKNH